MAILPTASFRGIPFYVKNMRDRNGRQYVIHQYPNQKNPYLEDLGYKTLFFEFDGFVSTDSNLYITRDLLEAAIRTKGQGLLIHPSRGSYKAVCIESEFAEEINEKGLVQCRLVFACATVKPQLPFTPMALIDTQGDLLEDALSGIGDLGSGLGGFAGALASTAIAGAVSSVATLGTSGIDSIFSNSTSGRHSQSYSDSSGTIVQKVKTSNAVSDKDKLNVATQTAIQTKTTGISNLNTSITAL